MTTTAPLLPPWLDREAYPFTTRFADLPSGRMHYVDEGRGDVLLFVHGTPTWSFEYRHLIRALSGRYRCIAPDHLGFGLSDRPDDASYTPEAHADRLRAFVRHLGLRRFTLIVHDYGGPIGLPLALTGDFDVERVVLLNTWMWPFDGDADMMRKGKLAGGTFGRFLYRYANASLRLLMPSAYGTRSKLTKDIHRQYLEVFRERSARLLVLHALAKALLGSREFYAHLYSRIERLRRLPALVVWGMKDSAFQPHQLDRWQAELPRAEVVKVDSAGHWPHEEHPSGVIRAIECFLEQRGSKSRPSAATAERTRTPLTA
jgi:haloalkane dehalogenase